MGGRVWGYDGGSVGAVLGWMDGGTDGGRDRLVMCFRRFIAWDFLEDYSRRRT